jgi:hypothetical protein
MVACSFTVWFYRHYLGGLLPLLAFLWICGAQNLSQLRTKNLSWGRPVFRLSLVLLLTLPWGLMAIAPDSGERAGPFAMNRHNIQQELLALHGKDLVLVTYLNHEKVDEEWVYNSADIDRSEIVWAHDLGKSENENLIRYFSNRRIWRLEINRDQPQLTEIPTVQAP